MDFNQQFRTRPPIEEELNQVKFKERHRRRMSLPVSSRAEYHETRLASTLADTQVTTALVDKLEKLQLEKKQQQQEAKAEVPSSSCSSCSDSEEELDQVSPRVRYQKCKDPPDYCIREMEDHEYGRSEIDYAQRGTHRQ